jgi:hypothetical protein
MANVDSEEEVCGSIHAMTVAGLFKVRKFLGLVI